MDLSEGILAPGMIDMQINGAFGVDFAAARKAGWKTALTHLPSTGATSIVPTFITAPLDQLIAAVQAYGQRQDHFNRQDGLARTLGLHLEGPFLSPAHCGAHNSTLLRDPDNAAVRDLIHAAAGSLAYVTLAPERPRAIDAIRQFVAAGIRVSVGHSDATDDMMDAAAEAGASLVTHLYNAQRGFHHREPGVVGASLTDDRFTLGLIADLHHVAPIAVRLAFAAASGRIALVSDAVAALGMPPGRYELGGEIVQVADGPARRIDGTIAGSTLRMDNAIANAVACGVPLPQAIAAATSTPADALGRPDLGRLIPGAFADVVWLGDDLRTRATWIDGELAYFAKGDH